MATHSLRMARKFRDLRERMGPGSQRPNSVGELGPTPDAASVGDGSALVDEALKVSHRVSLRFPFLGRSP